MDVEIWSDIACPWCYIGKRRFEAALERFEHRDQVRVTWRSFELHPDAPPERQGDLAARLGEKYGMSVEQARASQQNLTDMAAGEGLSYHFDKARSGNTFDAHRVIALAAEHGLQGAMKERLLSAYFTEGELVSDPEALVRLASEVGVPADAVRETLASDRFAEEVRDDELTARRLGISAVPTFVVDRALGASGAQPPDQLLALLEQGWEQQPHASATAQ
ncbi:MAG: DsbA family oxidoreductase [Solirubrobacteraceae bacterium]